MADPGERERIRLEVLENLDAARTQADRNQMGQFATPPRLASEIVSLALSLLSKRSKIRFLEPGFGTGPFYSALIGSIPPSRLKSATGFEIDPCYGKAARELWRETGLNLEIGDFALVSPPTQDEKKFNLVVCNPPYVRHHHMEVSYKQALKEKARHLANLEMSGLSGLYTYFLVLSKPWMSRRGIGAWLIPSEFMDVNYGREVKRFLLEEVSLLRIHRFDPTEVQFGDALVSSAVVFFRNEKPPVGHKVEFSFGGTLQQPKDSSPLKASDLQKYRKWSSLPERASAPIRENNGLTLGELFTIKRGLATGCNSFFLLPEDQAADLHLPGDVLQPILPSPRYLGSNIVESCRDGTPDIDKRLFLIACDLPEPKLRKKSPALWEYLQTGVTEGINTRYLTRNRTPWYSQENRPAAPILCSYMGRSTKDSDSPFRFFLNLSKATATNVFLMLYPKPILSEAMKSHPGIIRDIWKFLSSVKAENLIAEGRVYGGGLHKLEPKELSNLPIGNALKPLRKKLPTSFSRQLSLF